jgi:hypothetical protein
MTPTPLLLRLWDDYESANTRCRATYFAGMGHQRRFRDQGGRQRTTKQIRSTRSVEAGTR